MTFDFTFCGSAFFIIIKLHAYTGGTVSIAMPFGLDFIYVETLRTTDAVAHLPDVGFASSLAPTAVEEFLRYDGPSGALARVAAADLEYERAARLRDDLGPDWPQPASARSTLAARASRAGAAGMASP